jgi:predicted metalloprotease
MRWQRRTRDADIEDRRGSRDGGVWRFPGGGGLRLGLGGIAGSSAQRVESFRRGLESGRIDACDTFGR